MRNVLNEILVSSGRNAAIEMELDNCDELNEGVHVSMPTYRTHIGDLKSDEFYWDNPPEEAINGNTPNWLVPSAEVGRDNFMGLGLGYGWYQQVEKSGRFECRQLDWGAWGVKVTKTECLQLWDDCRPDEKETRHFEKWSKIRADIEARLQVDKDYVICVAEQP